MEDGRFAKERTYHVMELPSLDELMGDTFRTYRTARLQLLNLLTRPGSNRDPLAEFSEVLVAVLVGGRLADPNQKDYDVILPDDGKIQVKYLANSDRSPNNWHTVRFPTNVEYYALISFWNLQPKAAFIFSNGSLPQVYQALLKRHGEPEMTLQITESNIHTILKDPEKFKLLGVEIFNLQFAGSTSSDSTHE